MEIKLDLKDKKILYELDKDSRQSFQKIAKKVGLSKNAVSYRCNLLMKEGIITHSHAWIDLAKLGYLEFRMYFNLKNAGPKKEREIIDFLCKKKIVTWVGSMDGQYNLGIKVVTKNLHETHELWDELFRRYVNYIDGRLMTLIAGSNYYYKSYLIDAKKSDREESTTSTLGPEKLTEMERKIIGILSENSRRPIIEIAEILKVTPKTIIAHLKDLEKRKIIIGYGTVLDLGKIGYKTFRVSFILQRLTNQRMRDFRDYAHHHPNIIYDEEVIGGDDYEIEVQVRDIRDLRMIIQEIKSKFVDIIQDYKVLYVFEENKHIGAPIIF